jgi:hypothetical protein
MFLLFFIFLVCEVLGNDGWNVVCIVVEF